MGVHTKALKFNTLGIRVKEIVTMFVYKQFGYFGISDFESVDFCRKS